MKIEQLTNGNWAGEEINLVNYESQIFTPEFKTPEEVLLYIAELIANMSGFVMTIEYNNIKLHELFV